MTEKNFKYLVGDTLCYCQCIEHDIKWIYAMMRRGNSDRNYAYIEGWTLGKVVAELEELDFSDGNNYFSPADYELLKQITAERNYLAHTSFSDFVYRKDKDYKRAFAASSKRLVGFHKQVKRLWQTVEDIRIKFADKTRY